MSLSHSRQPKLISLAVTLTTAMIATGGAARAQAFNSALFVVGPGPAGASGLGDAPAVSTGLNSIAVGNGATDNGNGGSVVIGNAAQGAAGNAVAVGAGTFAAGATQGQQIESYRQAGALAQIVNAPAGTMSSNPTGTAVGSGSVVNAGGGVALGFNNVAGVNLNGNTFFSTAIGANNLAGGILSVALGDNNTASANSSITIGANNTASGLRAIAVGREALAAGDLSIAQGFLASSYGINSLALGPNATAGVNGGAAANDVAIGSGATSTLGNSVALGAGSVASRGAATAYNGYGVGATTSVGEVAVGTAAAARTISGVSAGQVATDAVNVSQLGTVGGNLATSLGGGANFNATTGTYTAPAYGVYGTTQGTVGGAITALQTLAPVQFSTAAAPTTPANPQTPSNNVTLVGATAGTPVALHNVAAGTVAAGSTDAVNGGQLAATNTNVTGNAANITNLNNGTAGVVQRTTTPGLVAITAPGGTANNPGATQVVGNVAAGLVNPASTQAINGSQLYGTANSVATALGGGSAVNPDGTVAAPAYTVAGTNYGDVGSAIGAINTGLTAGQLGAFRSNNAVNAAQPIDTGADSVAGGFGSSATGAASTVVGNGATDNANANATVLGNGASVAAGVGGSNVALGRNSTVAAAAVPVTNATIGGNTYVFAGGMPAGAVSVGAAGATRQIQNVAAGQIAAGSTDAINGSELFATNTQVGNNTNAIANLGTAVTNGATGPVQRTAAANQLALIAPGGSGAAPGQAQTLTNVAAGNVAAGSTDAVNGGQLAATNANVAGNAAGITNLNNGTAGVVQRTTTPGLVAITAPGGTANNPGAAQVVSNVAAGLVNPASTQAINGSQLYGTTNSVATALGGGSAVNPDGTVAAPTYTVAGTNYGDVGSAIGAINGAVSGGAGIKYFRANSTQPDAQAVGLNSVAVGPNAVSNGPASVAVGFNANTGATGSSIAIGSGAAANATTAAGGAVAIGTGNSATGNGAVAIGDPSTSNGQGAFAAGFNSIATADGTAAGGAANGAVAIGNTDIAAGQGAVAIGNTSQANNAGSVALGDTAVVQAGATRGLALGSGAISSIANSVALGAGSTTAAGTNVAAVTVAGTTFGVVGITPATAGVVSVGAAGAERQVQNVAAGRITAASTDAVNGSELFATNTAIGNVAAQTATLGGNVANALGGGSTYDPATGALTAPTYNVFGTPETGLGGAIAALQTLAPLQYSTAAGVPTPQTPSNDVTLVGANAGAPVALHNVAPGNVAAGSTDAVNGGQLAATNANVAGNTASITDLGNNINNGTAGTVQRTATANQLALVAPGGTGAAPGQAQNLTNVAAGAVNAASTDAINGSQLYGASQSVATALGGGSAVNPDGTVSAPAYTVGGATYNNVGGALGALNNSVAGGAGIKYFHSNSAAADSTAGGVDSIAVGPTATTGAAAPRAIAIGANAAATGADSIALGSGSTAEAANAPAVGTAATVTNASGATTVVGFNTTDRTLLGPVSVGSTNSYRQIQNVADGQAPTDAANIRQLQAGVQTAVNYTDTYAVKYAADGVTLNSPYAGGPVIIHNVGAGAVTAASTDAVNGAQLFGVQQVAANSVQYGSNPDGTRSNTVAFAGGNPNAPVRLANVAPGVAGTDAVNVNQLNNMAAYNQGQINALNQELNDTNRALRGGVAIALSAAGMRYDDRPGKVSISSGAAGYGGSVGLAFGLGGTSYDGKIRLNAAVAFSPNNSRTDVGVFGGGSYTLN